MIVLNAIVKVLDGKGDEAEQAFQKLVPKVLKDPGTITYAVHPRSNSISRLHKGLHAVEKVHTPGILRFRLGTALRTICLLGSTLFYYNNISGLPN